MIENKPLLFLDIDGVLNSSEYMVTLPPDFQNQDMISKEKMSLLNEISNDTNCKVILSSMWRFSFNIYQMNQMFRARGATFHIRDFTPVLSYREFDYEKASQDLGRIHRIDSDALKHTRRGLEIELWIRRNYPHHEIPHLRIAIVDDINNMYKLQPKLVQTDDAFGMTRSDCDAIKTMLSQPLGDLLNYKNDWYTKEAGIFGESQW